MSIISVLRSAELSGDLIKPTRFMHVDIESVNKILEKKPNQEECFRFILKNYPCLVKLVCTKLGEKDRYERYLKWYKNMTNVDEYTFYVHGYFIPWIDEQKEAGLLSEGR